MLILGIETSCDETAAAVVRDGRFVMSNVIASQIDIHREFGGVVPEIASRKHTENIVRTVDKALKDAETDKREIDAIAVTNGPGLVGALLTGLSFGKALSFALGKPLIGVNHIEGHMYANVLGDNPITPPFICLIVSGGHTHLLRVSDNWRMEVLGRTRDDAAGEAFDKTARALGLVKGVGGNRFAPDEPITRQELLVMTHSILKYLDKLPQARNTFAFSDIPEPWAAEAVNALAGAGIVVGFGGELGLTRNATRAEMAMILYRLLQ